MSAVNGFLAGLSDIGALSAQEARIGSALNVSAKDSGAAQRSAGEFEAVFIAQMLENMYGDADTADQFGGEETDDIYKSMMLQEYGKLITQSGGIGVADYVKRELLKTQEV